MAVIDFAILTGLLEEFEVVRDIFGPLEEDSKDAAIWYRGRLTSTNGVNYEIVAAFQQDMGPNDAIVLTMQVIKCWDPAYIIVVGIAGSFQEEVKLGDVIVSQQIFHYDPGKATPEGMRYRPMGYPCSPALVRQAEAFELDNPSFSAWQQAGNQSAREKADRLQGLAPRRMRMAQTELREHRPKIHFGTVASGNLVIADTGKQQELLALHGKIIGAEMEGAGVLHATFRQDIPTPAVVIKGISDAADSNKVSEDAKGYWRKLAAENPARMVFQMIRRGRFRATQADQFDLDPRPGSPVEARQVIREPTAYQAYEQGVPIHLVSFQAFPQLILPKGPLTGVRIGIDVIGNNGPQNIRKVAVRYVDIKGAKKTVESMSGSVEISEFISTAPVEVFMMSGGTPTRIDFRVATSSIQKTGEWSFRQAVKEP